MNTKHKALEKSKDGFRSKEHAMKKIRQSASGNPFKGFEKQIGLIRKDLKK